MRYLADLVPLSTREQPDWCLPRAGTDRVFLRGDDRRAGITHETSRGGHALAPEAQVERWLAVR